MGDSVKGFAEVWLDHSNSLSLIHQTGHWIIEGDQVGRLPEPFVNPCWLGLIPRLSRTCRVISLETICSITVRWRKESPPHRGSLLNLTQGTCLVF